MHGRLGTSSEAQRRERGWLGGLGLAKFLDCLVQRFEERFDFVDLEA